MGFQRIRKIAPFLIFLTLVVAFFWRILIGKRFLWGDFTDQNYPYRFFAATHLSEGTFPFWNPYIFAGMPFFADIQSAVLYPFNLLLIPFVHGGYLSPVVVEWVAIFHFLLAGIFMYFFIRTLGLGKHASILGGIIFMFCGFFVTHGSNINLIEASIWIPLLFLFVERIFRSRKTRDGIVGGFILGLSILAGYPQAVMFMGYALLLYILFRLISYTRAKERVTAIIWPLLLVPIIGFGLSAVQIMPATVLAKESVRPTMAYDNAVEGSFKPSQIITFLVPKFFGSWESGKRTYWGGEFWEYWETCGYVGVLPLILAILAMIYKRKQFMVTYLSLLLFLSFLLALGKYGPLYYLAYHFLPGFNRFRIPGRFVYLMGFSLTILASYGFDYLARNKPTRRFMLTFSIISGLMLFISLLHHVKSFPNIREVSALQYDLFLILWLCSYSLLYLYSKDRLKKTPLLSSMLLLVIIDLFLFGGKFNEGYLDPREFFAKNRLVNFLEIQNRKEISRINARLDPIVALRRNGGSIWRYFGIEGYNPLMLKRFSEIRRLRRDRWFDILNVKYRMVRMGNIVHLREVDSYLKRAFIVHQIKVLKREEKILKELNREDFNPNEVAIVKEYRPVEAGALEAKDSVSITSYSPNNIEIFAKTSKNGILVLSEIYYPAWKAYVDGERVKIFDVDYALRGLYLSEGEHKVKIVYDSEYFKIGLYISLLTIAFAVVLCFNTRHSLNDRRLL